MSITHIKSLSQLKDLLTAAGPKLTVIDFHATWCGPCHAIAPVYETLATANTEVQFLKCDVDDCADVAREYSISAMPSFVFIKNSERVELLRGANPGILTTKVKELA